MALRSLTVHLALHLLCEQRVDHAVAGEKRLPLELFAHHNNLHGAEVGRVIATETLGCYHGSTAVERSLLVVVLLYVYMNGIQHRTPSVVYHVRL